MTTTPGETLSPGEVLALAEQQKALAAGGPSVSEGPAPNPILMPGETQENGRTTVDPLLNPARAQAIANEAMGKGPAAPVVVQRPPIDVIELPAGWIDREGRLHKEARIRELRGSDEEELAKPYQRTAAKFVDTVVNRCTVDIGGSTLGPNDLQQLLIGDRDAIVIGVRILTFGPHIEVPAQCPQLDCRHEMVLDVDLESDIPQKELPFDPAESRTKELTLPRGEIVKVNLITGAAQLAAYNTADDLNESERISVLLSECIYSINDELVTGIQQIKDLSSGARRAISDFLGDNTCGPQWTAVKQTCPNCQTQFDLPLSLVGLFL